MNRVELLTKEINKRIKINEKSGEVISDWSPNNLRRLIIGSNYAFLQYHKTGGKFPKLLELINLQVATNSDLELLQTNYTKYIPVLKILTSGRVCTHIEEIVFDLTNYDGQMFVLDRDIAKQIGDPSTLEKRFPRLTNISFIESNMHEVGKHLQQSHKPDALLYDTLKDSNLEPTSLYTSPKYQTGKWQTGTSLRTSIYLFDKTLETHFARVAEKFTAANRQSELDEANRGRHRARYEKDLKPTLPLIASLLRTSTQAEDIFVSAPFISKGEWAGYLHTPNLNRGITNELRTRHETLRKKKQQQASQTSQQTSQQTNNVDDSDLTKLRRIDFKGVQDFLISENLTQEAKYIEQLQTYIHEQLLTQHVEDEYKRDSNKVDVQTSMLYIKEGVFMLYNVQFNMVFLAFAAYLSRNTPKYAMDFYGKFNPQPDPQLIEYTRTQIAFCNKHLPSVKEGYAKDALDVIGASEILAEQFTLQRKNVILKTILSAFGTLHTR